MSQFKKVLSVLLCLAMLLGTVAVAGTSFQTKGHAYVEGKSVVKSYSDLAQAHGSSPFAYIGIDYYEQSNGKLTDYYVDEGEILNGFVYIKSNLFFNNITFAYIFDNTVFDHIYAPGTTNYATGATVAATDFDIAAAQKDAKSPDKVFEAFVPFAYNANHAYKDYAPLSGGYTDYSVGQTTADLDDFKTRYPELATDAAKYDFLTLGLTRDGSQGQISMTGVPLSGDEYIITLQLKVIGKDGASGIAGASPYLYKATATGAAKRAGNIKAATTADGSSKNMNQLVYFEKEGTEDTFFCEDAVATFTVGKNPDDKGSGEGSGIVEGKTVVDSYSDLAQAHGSSPFAYIGIDYYEQSNGKLTDYYVDEGEILNGFVYIKSNLFFNNITFAYIFDNTVFDHIYAPGTTNYATGATVAATDFDIAAAQKNAASADKVFDSFVPFAYNANHAYKDYAPLSGGYTDYSVGQTTADLDDFKTRYPELATDAAKYDFLTLGLTRDGSQGQISMTGVPLSGDEYIITLQLKVIGKDGASGIAGASPYLYKATATGAAKRAGNIKAATTADGSSKNMNQLVYFEKEGTEDTFFCEDAVRTFNVGKNPEAGTGSGSYEAKFLDTNGGELGKKIYKTDEVIEAPDMSAKENFIGWANSKGEVILAADFKDIKMGTSALTFTAIYSTDKFDVTISFDGGKIDDKDSVTIQAAYGETVDMSAYKPTKAGYTLNGWEPSTVKVTNVKGTTAKALWKANTYKYAFYLNKADESAYISGNIEYNTKLTITPPTKAESNFDGWYDFDSDELVTSAGKFAQTYTYTNDEVKKFYAKWTDKDYAFTFMVYDYSKGEWKEFKKAYGNSGDRFAKADFTKISDAVTAEDIGWSGDFQIGNTAGAITTIFTYGTAASGFINPNTALTFNENKTIYIQTKIKYNVDVKIPKFEGGEYKAEYVTTSKTATSTASNAEAKLTVNLSDYAPAKGYDFKEWTFSGTAVPYTQNTTGTTFTFSYASGAKVEIIASYELTRYNIRFFIGDEKNSKAVSVIGTQIGSQIKLDADYVIEGKQTGILLPEIGVENSEQTTPYEGMNGYKFAGFYFKDDAEMVLQQFPLVLTQEMLETYDKNGTGTLDFRGKWEAEKYDAVFNYTMSDGSTKSFTISGVPTGARFDTYTPDNEFSEEFQMTFGAYVRQNAPEGKRFTGWKSNAQSVENIMLPGGVTYTAVYASNSYNIYINLDRGGELTDDVVQKFSSSYGDDIEAPGTETGEGMGNGTKIRSMLFSEAEKPSSECEYVGWKVFHLIDESKGIYDKSNWAEGINDEGTTIMRGTVIYQPEWKFHREFFFRVFGNGGSDDLYCGLGKDFKMYFFNNHRPCKAGDSSINKSPELNLIFGFIPKLENFDFKGFFTAEMWKHVYLRFDAISIPKAVFTWEGFSGLASAAFTAIKTLIKGE